MDVCRHDSDFQNLGSFPNRDCPEVVGQKAGDPGIDERRPIAGGPDQMVVESVGHIFDCSAGTTSGHHHYLARKGLDDAKRNGAPNGGPHSMANFGPVLSRDAAPLERRGPSLGFSRGSGVSSRAGTTSGHHHYFARKGDRKSTRLNSSHTVISYAVFCLKKKKKKQQTYAPKKKKSQRKTQRNTAPR